MNVDQRKKMVDDGHIRSVYGGRFEPLFHTAMIFTPFIFLYVIYGSSAIGLYLLPIFSFIFLVFGLSALSFFWVARIRELGDDVEFKRINVVLEECGFNIKAKGKYFVDAYIEGEAILSPDTHILFFVFNRRIYGASWRYASRGWRFMPFYTGVDQLNNIWGQVGANKTLNLTPKSGAN